MNLLTLIFIIFVIYILTSNFRKNPQNLSGYHPNFAFAEAKYLVALIAKVAKSDGHVNELEAHLISEILDDITARLGGSTAIRENLKQIYNIEKENLNNTYELANEYSRQFIPSHDVAVARIAFLINLAYIDGSISRAEMDIIESIASGFGVKNSALRIILSQFESFYDNRSSRNSYQDSSLKQSVKNPYDVLGLPHNVSFEVVKKRYRELVKKYHPDILMGRGESDEMIQNSTQKLQEINEAYEEIKNRQ
ncbi:DnaJ domain-containing protein [Campylobacter sp. faydin G-24]|uniref:DnaJ domain-containing protein n=1 Tax=Campylobacter anatolicus TaxID=2829105 RepID=A0ABS5HIP6_9BACT|nr:DnaJ domain-containing protein [Campylobacter anatolicus]MBR8462691.1 DnaJ domain-containing protein [Campylobacter anatolicus]MBR8464141.1 DnaJ domain-containing protein [Campylobacter anatolicus]MBR8466046.1 DnaJ domain-containing protein [Campylobacter anatolicus]